MLNVHFQLLFRSPSWLCVSSQPSLVSNQSLDILTEPLFGQRSQGWPWREWDELASLKGIFAILSGVYWYGRECFISKGLNNCKPTLQFKGECRWNGSANWFSTVWMQRTWALSIVFFNSDVWLHSVWMFDYIASAVNIPISVQIYVKH